MTNSLTDAEARLALHEVEQGRQRVIDQIGMPRWYWWGLAACWIALGVLNDIANAWVIAVATVTSARFTPPSRNGCSAAGGARAASRSAPMSQADVHR
jgi:hypothetical protein